MGGYSPNIPPGTAVDGEGDLQVDPHTESGNNAKGIGNTGEWSEFQVDHLLIFPQVLMMLVMVSVGKLVLLVRN